MRSALAAAVVFSLCSHLACGFDDKDLVPVKPGVQCMWHYNAGGAHVCFFEYKLVNMDVEKLLEGAFEGCQFYVFAVWNEEGKSNFVYDQASHTFRLYSKSNRETEKRPRVYGNCDPWEGFVPRINDRISQINTQLSYVDDMLLKLQYNRAFSADMFSDESGQWAKARKLTTPTALNAYKAKLNAGATTLQNLGAVMRPFNCAVGDKAWALCPVRREKPPIPLDSVFLVSGDEQVPMERVAFTKTLLHKLDLKQREFGARTEIR
jgi:hypothetical protein